MGDFCLLLLSLVIRLATHNFPPSLSLSLPLIWWTISFAFWSIFTFSSLVLIVNFRVLVWELITALLLNWYCFMFNCGLKPISVYYAYRTNVWVLLRIDSGLDRDSNSEPAITSNLQLWFPMLFISWMKILAQSSFAPVINLINGNSFIGIFDCLSKDHSKFIHGIFLSLLFILSIFTCRKFEYFFLSFWKQRSFKIPPTIPFPFTFFWHTKLTKWWNLISCMCAIKIDGSDTIHYRKWFM